MKKRGIVLALAVLLLSSAFLNADSFSFSTRINSVSGGPDGFGMSLFPLGTDFEYNAGFQMIKSSPYKANLEVRMVFSFSEVSLGNYDYITGEPWWADGQIKNELEGTYFRPVSQLTVTLSQGFGVNPVAGSGNLVNVSLAYFTRFAMARESINLFSDEDSNNPVFLDSVYTSGNPIPAYPWLYGNRINWNNAVRLSSSLYLRRTTTNTDNHTGAYFNLTLEAGPSWLGNTVSSGTSTSNYIKFSAEATEYLTVFVIEQDNGWNWLNLELGHTNTGGYIWGDIIPEHQISTDRLRGHLTDKVWLRFTGPQFLAGDCYPYFELSLNNNLFFGSVQNNSISTSGVELRSSVNGEIHLRLFGFIHVNYQFGYNFIKGFDAMKPNWTQSASLGFYVSL